MYSHIVHGFAFYGVYKLISDWYHRRNNEKYRPNLDAIPSDIYKLIDFEKCVIGGSYALHQFTKPTNWYPNDIDIMYGSTTSDLREFSKMVNKFVKQSKSQISVKIRNRKELIKAKQDEGEHTEGFDHRIIGTVTLKVPNVKFKVQFICIDLNGDNYNNKKSTTLQDVLNDITDLPSCVNYTWSEGNKIFHVPEKAIDSLLHDKPIIYSQICSTRLNKYSKRGYKFTWIHDRK